MIFDVMVEISKGSAKKYEYDEVKKAMVLDFVFKDGLKFIFNYGFIPNTRAGDGDTLDVILLGSGPIASGTMVAARAIGIMKMLDRGEPDDKIIAVLADAPDQKYDPDEFKRFYAEIARQKQKIVEITGFEDANAAMAEIKKAMI